MILFDLTGNEEDPNYKALEVSNGTRQYDFLRSVVEASLAYKRKFLSEHILKAFNYHAITCLHSHAGEYRPCRVRVGKGPTRYRPPESYQVAPLMEDFVNDVNSAWNRQGTDEIALAAFVLWRLNHIHPFINGNGRTARAACYFVLCVSAQGWIRGTKILPELLRQNRDEYVVALKAVDQSAKPGNQFDISPLHALLVRLLQEQIQSDPSLNQAAPTASTPTNSPPASPHSA